MSFFMKLVSYVGNIDLIKEKLSHDFMIHNRYNFNAAICESQCKRSDHCQFWRVYQNDTMELPECLHLSIDYHQVRQYTY